MSNMNESCNKTNIIETVLLKKIETKRYNLNKTYYFCNIFFVLHVEDD